MSKYSLFFCVITSTGRPQTSNSQVLLISRHLQISLGHGDPFTGISMPQLDYVLRGIKKHQAPRAADRPSRLLVTPVVLEKFRRVWQGTTQQFGKSHNLHRPRSLWPGTCALKRESGGMLNEV